MINRIGSTVVAGAFSLALDANIREKIAKYSKLTFDKLLEKYLTTSENDSITCEITTPSAQFVSNNKVMGGKQTKNKHSALANNFPRFNEPKKINVADRYIIQFSTISPPGPNRLIANL
jgi:hypothetical protein